MQVIFDRVHQFVKELRSGGPHSPGAPAQKVSRADTAEAAWLLRSGIGHVIAIVLRQLRLTMNASWFHFVVTRLARQMAPQRTCSLRQQSAA